MFFNLVNFVDLFIMVIGALAGWFSRAWWQAALAGLIIGAIAGAVVNYLIPGQDLVLIADPLGATIWTLLLYGLKTILNARKARKALQLNSN